jgi:TPR repeat protein
LLHIDTFSFFKCGEFPINIAKLLVLSYLIFLTPIIGGRAACMEQKTDPVSLYNNGVRYYNGLGVNQDKTEAAKLFHKAAEQGQVNAQLYLGICYDKGTGVNQNKTEAAKWCRKAAEQGDAKAQFRLGEYYDKGEGVTQDKVEAAKLFHKAAEQGHITARFRLGEYYDKGEGVMQDTAEAVKWIHKAAEQGHVTAQLYNGMYYDKGTGVTQDKAEAVKWYRKAAEQGQVNAQFRLAVCYEKGEGVAQDKVEAAKWYRKAAGQGNALAEKRLYELKNELLESSNTANQPQGKNSKAKKNQKQNIQKNLTPEEFKKAEEAAQKAMEELLAGEAKPRKNKPSTKGNSIQVKEKGKGEKKKGKDEHSKTIQITNSKKETDKSSEEKPNVDNVSKKNAQKVGNVGNLPTNMNASQIQNQGNASKQKTHPNKTNQAPYAFKNKHTLVSSINHNGTQEPAAHIGKIKEKKISKQKNFIPTQVIKEQEEKTESREEKNNNVGPGIMKQTEHKAICLNLISIANNNEVETAIGEKQLLVAGDQQESISNLQHNISKQKESKTIWCNVKDKFRKDKTENHSEKEKDVKREKNKNAMSSPSSNLATVNPTTDTNGRSEKVSYSFHPLRYVRIPILIPVRIPVYIPVSTGYSSIPTTYPYNSVDKPKLWVPYTQITYEDKKKIIAQWNEEGRGSVHVMHPDSDAIGLEENYLNNRLRHLKNCLQRHGYPLENQWNTNKNSSSHIIHHGGEAAKQKNDELKKTISYLKRILQEKGWDEFK